MLKAQEEEEAAGKNGKCLLVVVVFSSFIKSVRSQYTMMSF
jgi:hypothetical protein